MKIQINPAHIFELTYLVDNGRLHDWPGDTIKAYLVRWLEDDGTETFSVYRADDLEARHPIGSGDTKEWAIRYASCRLTDLRRKADGIIPAKVSGG